MTPSHDELMRALPHVLAAPKDGAAIAHLCLRPARNARRFVDEITVTHEHGIPGERWLTQPWLRTKDGAPHPGIQVCVISQRVLDLIWRPGDYTPHPGDTFAADMDMSEGNLPVGQKLAVGRAILQVSDVFNDACVKWKARYGADSHAWVRMAEHRGYRLRGILCRVVQNGTICTGDILSKIAEK